MKFRSMMTVVGACAVVGCGGGASSAQAPGKSTSATAAEGDPDLGHFSSLDGMVHLVLDRSGTKAKVRMDGSKDIVELTSQEVRDRGDLRGHSFRAPDGKPVLFLSKEGGWFYVGGRDEHSLRRDGESPKLGNPTVAGTPPVPPVTKSAGELAFEKLRGIAVTKRSKLTVKDASNLKLVSEAFETADKGMFVHFVAGSKKTARYHPSDNDTFTASKSEASGLGKYGGRLLHVINVERGELKAWGLQLGAFDTPPLAEGTPGLVWDVDTDRTLFVTADGTGYEIDHAEDGSDVAVGVDGAIAKWPAALQQTALGPAEIRALATSGAIAKEAAEPFDKAQDAWRKCVEGSYVGGLMKELKKLDTENIQWSAREARKKEAHEQWSTKVTKECSAHETKLESMLVAFVEVRNKERSALAEKVKSRAVALGLAK